MSYMLLLSLTKLVKPTKFDLRQNLKVHLYSRKKKYTYLWTERLNNQMVIFFHNDSSVDWTML